MGSKKRNYKKNVPKGRQQNNDPDPIDDTFEEIILLLLVVITFGMAFILCQKKRVYKWSYIHFLFKYIDFFDVKVEQNNRRCRCDDVALVG